MMPMTATVVPMISDSVSESVMESRSSSAVLLPAGLLMTGALYPLSLKTILKAGLPMASESSSLLYVIVVIPPLLIRRNIHFLCHSRRNAYLLREVLVVEGLPCHVLVFDPEADIFDVLARVISQSQCPLVVRCPLFIGNHRDGMKRILAYGKNGQCQEQGEARDDKSLGFHCSEFCFIFNSSVANLLKNCD